MVKKKYTAVTMNDYIKLHNYIKEKNSEGIIDNNSSTQEILQMSIKYMGCPISISTIKRICHNLGISYKWKHGSAVREEDLGFRCACGKIYTIKIRENKNHG